MYMSMHTHTGKQTTTMKRLPWIDFPLHSSPFSPLTYTEGSAHSGLGTRAWSQFHASSTGLDPGLFQSAVFPRWPRDITVTGLHENPQHQFSGSTSMRLDLPHGATLWLRRHSREAAWVWDHSILHWASPGRRPAARELIQCQYISSIPNKGTDCTWGSLLAEWRHYNSMERVSAYLIYMDAKTSRSQRLRGTTRKAIFLLSFCHCERPKTKDLDLEIEESCLLLPSDPHSAQGLRCLGLGPEQ